MGFIPPHNMLNLLYITTNGLEYSIIFHHPVALMCHIYTFASVLMQLYSQLFFYATTQVKNGHVQAYVKVVKIITPYFQCI
jgi:hypothetical protein